MVRVATTTTTLAAILVTFAHAGAAQQLPRPGESRTVTPSVTEYNRLIDLAGRPPQAPTSAPVAAVLSSADLRVRVDRETVRGVFNLAGDVLRAGVARVNLLAGHITHVEQVLQQIVIFCSHVENRPRY